MEFGGLRRALCGATEARRSALAQLANSVYQSRHCWSLSVGSAAHPTAGGPERHRSLISSFP